LKDAGVTGDLLMGEGATIAGGQTPVTLGDGVVLGPAASLEGTIRVRDGVEIGESARIEGPTGGYDEDIITEIDAGCEVLDRAHLSPGVRLGERSIVASKAEVGTQVVTGAGTEIGDRSSVGDFSRLGGS